MAPTYASLFMGKLEEKLKEFGKQHIMLWKRFIDDIFVIWTRSASEFTTLTSTKYIPQSNSHMNQAKQSSHSWT